MRVCWGEWASNFWIRVWGLGFGCKFMWIVGENGIDELIIIIVRQGSGLPAPEPVQAGL